MLLLLKKYSHWLLIAVGTLLWSLTTIKSGIVYPFGMGFWGPHGHDGIWHLALISSLARGSFEMPVFAGQPIQNYHLGFDLLAALLHRLSALPVSILYFQILPPVMALLIGVLTYHLIRSLTSSATSAWWSVFFVYFGGGLGWALGKGESAFWSQQAISTLINPPLALSFILLLLLLLLLLKKHYLLAGIILGLLPHVKIYAGLLVFGGLAVASLRNRNLLKTLIIGLVVYLPVGFPLLTTNTRLLVWQPGWFLDSLMGAPDRLDWPKFYSAMTTYRLSHNWLKGLPAYTAAFGVFLVGNMGTRLLSLVSLKQTASHWFYLFATSVIVAGTIIPMFFLQVGTPWNTIQFFYYSLFFAALLAGPAVSELLLKFKDLKLKIILALLVIGFTVPTTYDTLTKVYLPARPPAKISTQELQALDFLSTLPAGVVLVPPANPNPYAPPPRPLYLYESTAYVSAFSAHPTYIEDEVNLNITGYDWATRRQAVEEFFRTTDSASARQFLQANSIRYLYLPEVASVQPILSETDLGLAKLYENTTTAIWGISE